jgi:hypothetical protein
MGTGVQELNLGHRPHTHQRRARGRPDDARLGDRRVDDALRAEVVPKALRELKRAPVGADVLAEQEDALVVLHLLPERLTQRLEKGLRGHQM